MKFNLNFLFLCTSLVILVGALFYFFSTFFFLGKEVSNTEVSSIYQTTDSPKSQSYFGVVSKLDPITSESGTHRLADSKGKTVAYLESKKIDLQILEGASAAIEGRFKRMIEAGVPLLEVEKVNFK